MNRGLSVLDQARAFDPCHRPEGSWALGTRMRCSVDEKHFPHHDSDFSGVVCS